jgi:hypothetical protein
MILLNSKTPINAILKLSVKITKPYLCKKGYSFFLLAW